MSCWHRPWRSPSPNCKKPFAALSKRASSSSAAFRRVGRVTRNSRAQAAGARYPPFHLTLQAEALALVGEIEEALAALDDALAEAAVSGERGWSAETHRLCGELTGRLPHPDPAKAEDSFRTALVIAREQGTRGYELRAAKNLARLWGKQGRRAEARDLLAPVYASFTEGFHTADLKEAKRLLDELS